MEKITSIIAFSLLGTLLITACAQPPKPEWTIITPDGGGTAPTSKPDGAGIVSTVVPGSPTPDITSASGSSGTPLSEMTPEPTAVLVIVPAPDGQIITTEDNGRTITMQVGESFLLHLGEIYNWEISLSNENVLSRVKNIAVARGAQGVYLAQQPGTVTINANGDPLCRQSKPPCGMPSILIAINVVVK